MRYRRAGLQITAEHEAADETALFYPSQLPDIVAGTTGILLRSHEG